MSLKYGLLGLLSYYDMSGYDLKKTFESSLQFMWSAKASQIYRELGKMEKEGLVSYVIEEQDKKFNRKVYSITEPGKESFLEWVNHFPKNLEMPIRDEFIVRLFFGENVSTENLIFEIKRYKKQREETMSVLSEISESAKKASIEEGIERAYYFWSLTIKKAIKEIHAEIEWAEETIEELNKRG